MEEKFFEQICRTFNWQMSTASTATTVTAAGELSKSVAYLNRILEHKSLVCSMYWSIDGVAIAADDSTRALFVRSRISRIFLCEVYD